MEGLRSASSRPLNASLPRHIPRSTAPGPLQDISAVEFFEYDTRPTFVLDAGHVDPESKHQNVIVPAYSNPAMAAVPGLAASLLTTGILDTTFANGSTNAERQLNLLQFRAWIFRDGEESRQFVFSSFTWTKIGIPRRHGHWTVVSGVPYDTPASPGVASRKSSKSTNATFDWTNEVPPSNLTPHMAWARSIDWAQTSMGPMALWSPQLRCFANLVLLDPRPAILFYGSDLTMLYNKSYIELVGDIHPCMGVSARVAFQDFWEERFEPLVAGNRLGEVVEKTDYHVRVHRNGFGEETYFSFKFMPVLDSDGATVGSYQTVVETTRHVMAIRRSQTLLELSEEVPQSKDTDSYWPLTTEILSRNDKDIPFALLYSAEAHASTCSPGPAAVSHADGSFIDDLHCTLQGSLGGSSAGPEHLDFREDLGFTPYLRQALLARKPTTVHFHQNSPITKLVRDVAWKGFGEPCKAAVICPLIPIGSTDTVLGFVVVGLNPRRPYDEDYQRFILVATRLLTATLTSILSHKDDIQGKERAIATAEATKVVLEQQLVKYQKEAERNIFKFQRFAERSDVGIFIIRQSDGVYTYRNEAWFTILNPSIDRDIDLGDAWGALIDDEYAPVGKSKFGALMDTKQHQSFELRLKRTWDVPDQSYGISVPEKQREQPMWVLCSIFPQLEDGEVLEIIGCITDISRQKWSEKVQATQATLAQESKKQLENFIDTTSHEMRNPLSAILHCADDIITSQQRFDESTDHVVLSKIMRDMTESAETILQCGAHMKSIVDDVLTLSKLESELFVMTPVDVHVDLLTRDALKMFEGEAKSYGIDLVLHLEESYTKLKHTKISLDPTRVMQVLINLLTNGIKFTRLEIKRQISISLGVTFELPLHHLDTVHGNVPLTHVSETSDPAKTLQSDWEKGQMIYPVISVRDTGRGMSDAEHALLFHRFSQTSPRTHIDYGGSGLGLYISRRLAEMHGGAIGFASRAGVGSTFAFYIKGRMCAAPQPPPPVHVAPQQATSTASANGTGTQGSLTVPRVLPASGISSKASHILIVEDNLVNQRVLAKQLRNLGVQVAVANHGGEALDYLRSTKYYCQADDEAAGHSLSLILMDWEMPVMDGLTCVRNIRKLQREGVMKGHVPVIGITANVRSEQVHDALEAGMDNVMSKPFRIPELCACIEKTLQTLVGRRSRG